MKLFVKILFGLAEFLTALTIFGSLAFFAIMFYAG